jgi:hypothetical protein
MMVSSSAVSIPCAPSASAQGSGSRQIRGGTAGDMRAGPRRWKAPSATAARNSQMKGGNHVNMAR